MMSDKDEAGYLHPLPLDPDCLALPDSYLVKKRLSVHLEKRRGSLTDYVREHASHALSYLLRSPSTTSVASSTAGDSAAGQETPVQDIYGFRVRDLNDNEVSLDKYRGFVLVIVNVASECGLTQVNYEQLSSLYAKYADRGLRVAAFPCNQFAQQEPGSAQDISRFVSKADVKFDVYAKVDVNGKDADPLFAFLQSRLPGSITNDIKWNFTKFLINRKGHPVNRFSPTTSPLAMEEEILHLLRK